GVRPGAPDEGPDREARVDREGGRRGRRGDPPPRRRPPAGGRRDAPSGGVAHSPDSLISSRAPVAGSPRRMRWLFVSAMYRRPSNTARPPGSRRTAGLPSPNTVRVSIEPKAIPLILLLYESAT